MRIIVIVMSIMLSGCVSRGLAAAHYNLMGYTPSEATILAYECGWDCDVSQFPNLEGK